MNWIPQMFRRRKFYADLSEEIRLHIEERTEQLVREGMSAEEAAQAAKRAFGNHMLLEERSREVWQWPTVESIGADLWYAARQLRGSPGFALIAVTTLALAIGANGLVFGVLNALILRPLNVPQAESLFLVQHGNDFSTHSYPDYRDLRQRNHSFDDLATCTISQAGLDTGKDPSNVWNYETSANYFDVLRIYPYLGRFFHDADEHGPNSMPYVVLSYAYWHSHFHDDRGVVGSVVRLNEHPFTILGVAPPGFRGTLLFYAPDIFLPIVNHEQLTGEKILEARELPWLFEVMGHLKPGVTTAQATADLNSVNAFLKKSYPKEESKEPYSLSRPGLHSDLLGRTMQGFLTGLMLLSGLILLAACANLGSLFAARAADHSRELALRLALGSSRNRILRQLFTEALLLSCAGGILGLAGTVVLLRRLSVWQPFPQFPMHVPVNPDAGVYLLALVLALVSGILFGIVPVRQVLRANPYEIVKAGSTGAFGRRITVRDVLLVVQIAICAVLVTSSLVAVRGLMRSMHFNFGFDPHNVMLVDTELKSAGYTGDRIPPMQRRMIDALQGIPGVDSVGSVNHPQLEMGSP
jgi:predicted permease